MRRRKTALIVLTALLLTAGISALSATPIRGKGTGKTEEEAEKAALYDLSSAILRLTDYRVTPDLASNFSSPESLGIGYPAFWQADDEVTAVYSIEEEAAPDYAAKADELYLKLKTLDLNREFPTLKEGLAYLSGMHDAYAEFVYNSSIAAVLSDGRYEIPRMNYSYATLHAACMLYVDNAIGNISKTVGELAKKEEKGTITEEELSLLSSSKDELEYLNGEKTLLQKQNEKTSTVLSRSLTDEEASMLKKAGKDLVSGYVRYGNTYASEIKKCEKLRAEYAERISAARQFMIDATNRWSGDIANLVKDPLNPYDYDIEKYDRTLELEKETNREEEKAKKDLRAIREKMVKALENLSDQHFRSTSDDGNSAVCIHSYDEERDAFLASVLLLDGPVRMAHEFAIPYDALINSTEGENRLEKASSFIKLCRIMPDMIYSEAVYRISGSLESPAYDVTIDEVIIRRRDNGLILSIETDASSTIVWKSMPCNMTSTDLGTPSPDMTIPDAFEKKNETEQLKKIEDERKKALDAEKKQADAEALAEQKAAERARKKAQKAAHFVRRENQWVNYTLSLNLESGIGYDSNFDLSAFQLSGYLQFYFPNGDRSNISHSVLFGVDMESSLKDDSREAPGSSGNTIYPDISDTPDSFGRRFIYVGYGLNYIISDSMLVNGRVKIGGTSVDCGQYYEKTGGFGLELAGGMEFALSNIGTCSLSTGFKLASDHQDSYTAVPFFRVGLSVNSLAILML